MRFTKLLAAVAALGASSAWVSPAQAVLVDFSVTFNVTVTDNSQPSSPPDHFQLPIRFTGDSANVMLDDGWLWSVAGPHMFLERDWNNFIHLTWDGVIAKDLSNLSALTVTGGRLDYPGFPLSWTGIAVQGAPAVPEPASWALMIAGFAVVGGALRSRRARGNREASVRVAFA